MDAHSSSCDLWQSIACCAGDNTVMMQQVAKSLVEDTSVGQVAKPRVASLEQLDSVCITDLLNFRLATMVQMLKASMRQAFGRVGGGKAGAAAAADAFELNGDLAKDIGWAFAHQYCYTNFVKVHLFTHCLLMWYIEHICSTAITNAGFMIGCNAGHRLRTWG